MFDLTNQNQITEKMDNVQIIYLSAKWINRPEDKIKYSSQWMTKQCFWINNTYIKQVEDLL